MIYVKVLKSKSLEGGVEEISSLHRLAEDKINAFVSKMIHDHELIRLTPTEKKNPLLVNISTVGPSRTARQKLISKILTSISTNLQKKIPFISKSVFFKKILPKDNAGNIVIPLPVLNVSIPVSEIGDHVEKHRPYYRSFNDTFFARRSRDDLKNVVSYISHHPTNGPATGPLLEEYSKSFIPITRYVKYISFLCRKYGFPMKLYIHFTEQIQSPKVIDNYLTYRLHPSLQIAMGQWNGINFISENVSSRRDNGRGLALGKAFLFIPQIVQVVQTLYKKGGLDGSVHAL